MDTKVIEYIINNDVDDIMKALQHRSDKSKIIDILKRSRIDYGMRIQKIIEELMK